MPPKYETVYDTVVYEPGHWEWRESTACGPTQDKRAFGKPRAMKRACTSCEKPAKALDCGCPRTN